MIEAIFFYAFSAVLVLSAVMVISAKNPIHSVLFLILAFFNAAGLFVMLGAEFIAMILVIVYVGAVAVLFLFVVMMLDINLTELRQGFLQYLPIGALIGLVLVIELIFVLAGWQLSPELASMAQAPAAALGDKSNTAQLGEILYTRYAFLFQGAGIVLLIAMMGAIVLTLRHRDIKRQKISRQVAQKPADTIEIRKVRPGEGV